MSLLTGFRVVQLGRGLAAAICGRLLADVGAGVVCIDPDASTPFAEYLNHDKRIAPDDAAAGALAGVDMILCEGRRSDLQARQYDPDTLRRRNPTAALVYISPYGLTGPNADDPATDLTLFFASGIARLLTGQVDDLARTADPPGRRAIGVHRRPGRRLRRNARRTPRRDPALIDVSIEEALATMAIGELANAGLGRQQPPAQARRGRQWRDGHDPAGKRRLCRDLAARRSAMGGVADGDGFARLGQ